MTPSFFKIINASSSFDKEQNFDFLDNPHFKQVLVDFFEAGHNSVMGKEEREIIMIQIMFKNTEYVIASMDSGMGKYLVNYINSRKYVNTTYKNITSIIILLIHSFFQSQSSI